MTVPGDATAVPTLSALIVSAPFGNYVQPAGTTPTLGTFTAAARSGRVIQILRTVRRYRRIGAWVNRIGLRNPGIAWLAGRVAAGRVNLSDKLVSVHGFSEDDWWKLLDVIADLKPLGVELNMSCPNVGHIDWPENLFDRAMATGVPVVVKLPPVNYQQMFEQAIAARVRCFHCCNTLPVPAGGLSGKPLKPVSLAVIRAIRTRPEGTGLVIVGGGGITDPADIDDFRAAGADHFAVGTKVMHPKYLFSDGGIRPLIEFADRG